MFIHAVNPYGMAEWRRFNENNVDLNRNLFVSQEEMEEKVLGRDINIAGYTDFDHLFNPAKPPSYFQDLLFYPKITLTGMRHGLKTFKRALVTAQYKRQTGIFFGGRKLQKSWENIIGLLESQGYLKAKKLFLWDIHTGLGPKGWDTTLVQTEEHYNKFKKMCPDAPYVDNEGSGNAGKTEGTSGAGDGYSLVDGLSKNLKYLFKDAEEIFAGTQEFGTVPMPQVAYAIIRNNQATNHGTQDQIKRSRKFCRDAFYLSDDFWWKQNILKRGRKVFHQMLAALGDGVKRVLDEEKHNDE